MSIQHVMLDADGVMQTIPGGQAALAEPFLGESVDVLDEILVDELPALRGESDFREDLRRAFGRHGIGADPDEFYAALWNAIDVSPDMVELVHRLRAAGYGVHLGTNQHEQRGRHLRDELGYGELFDVGCYSYELGAAKPERAFFEHALDRIGAPAAQVLFIDDRADNVEGARSVGLAAERWDLEVGLPALRALLGRHGVVVNSR